MKTLQVKRLSVITLLISVHFCLFSPSKGYSEWVSINGGHAGAVYDVQYRSGMLYCATDSGLYSTSDNTSWTTSGLYDETTSQTIMASTMQTIQFTSASTALMSGMMYMGNSEVIFRTVNSGKSWTMVNLSNDGDWPRMFNKIRFTDDLHGFAAGSNGRVLATGNGGTSWSALSSGTPATLYDIAFVSTSRGFMVGDNCIVKTENGGGAWAVTTVNGELVAVSFFHPDSGYAAGGNTLLSTTNGGSTWQPVPTPFSDITALYAISGEKLLVGHSGGAALGLAGCSYWENVPQMPSEKINALCGADSTRIYAGYEKGMIYYTATGTGIGVPRASLTTSATTVCPGASLVFTTSGPAHYQFSWLHNRQSAGSGRTSTITFSTPGVLDTVSLIVSNGSFSDTVHQTISVNPRFKPTVLTAAADDSVCAGTTARIYIYQAERNQTYTLNYKGVQVASAKADRDTVSLSTPPIDSPMVFEVAVTIAYMCETVTATSQVAVWAAPIKTDLHVSAQKTVLLNGDSTFITVAATEAETKYQLYTDSDFRRGVYSELRDTAKPGNGGELMFATGSISGTRSFMIKAINRFGCEKQLAATVAVTGREFYVKANTGSMNYIIGDTVSFENSSVADSFTWIFDASCSIPYTSEVQPKVVFTTVGEKTITLIGKMSFGAIDTQTMSVHLFEKADASSGVGFCRVDSLGAAFPVDHPSLVKVYAVQGDSAGIVYSAGHFRYGFSNFNFFIRKLDGTGRVLWELHDESMRVNSSIATLTTDSKGNLYAGGSFNGEFLQIGDTAIVCDTESNRVHQGFQNFLVKLDQNGKVKWVIQGISDLYSNPTGVSDIVRINDNRFVMTIANPARFTRFTDTTVTTMNTDIVVAEIDSGGRLVHLLTTPDSYSSPEMTGICFSIVPSGSSISIAHSVTVSPKVKVGPDGNIYLYGKFRSDKKFSDAVAVKGHGTGKNGCIAVINAGAWQWDTAFVLYGSNVQTKYGSIESGILPVFDIDKQGNIYVAEMPADDGYFFGSETMTNQKKGFVGKYGSKGELLWKNATAGMAILNVALSGDNCMLFGSIWGTSGIFSQNGSEKAVRSNGDADIILGAIGQNGAVSWMEAIGSSGLDCSMFMGKGADERLYMALTTEMVTAYHTLTIPAKTGQISLVSFAPSGDCTPYAPAAVKQRRTNTSSAAPFSAGTPQLKAGPVPVTAGSGDLLFYLDCKTSCTYELSVYNALGTNVHRQQGYHLVTRSGRVADNIKPWNLRDAKGDLVARGTYLAIATCTDRTSGERWQIRCMIGVK